MYSLLCTVLFASCVSSVLFSSDRCFTWVYFTCSYWLSNDLILSLFNFLLLVTDLTPAPLPSLFLSSVFLSLTSCALFYCCHDFVCHLRLATASLVLLSLSFFFCTLSPTPETYFLALHAPLLISPHPILRPTLFSRIPPSAAASCRSSSST